MLAPLLRLRIIDAGAPEWSRLVGGFEGLSLMQCWEYGEAKRATGPWTVERGVFLDGGEPVGAVQALVRRPLLGRGGLVWINRGPLWRREAADDGVGVALLLTMLTELRRHFADAAHMYMRVALPVEDGPPPAETVATTGLSVSSTPGWASARLDLEASLESLRRGLRQNWRNGLAKAERSGIEVESGADGRLFTHFLERYREMTAERRFTTTVTADLLARLQALLPPGRKLETFIARVEERAVATLVATRYGWTSEYLAATTTPEGRSRNAGQLLLWRAVEAAKRQGCRYFDVGGMDPDLTPAGVFRFKRGLGARPYRLLPELEVNGAGLIGRLIRWRVRRARSSGHG